MSQAASDTHESNRAFYDRIADAYDLIANASEKPARLKGLGALNLTSGEMALEIGFGTGNELIDMARLVGADGQVSGIDISPGMEKVASRKLGAAKVSADLMIGDARELPFADGTFDAAYSSFTLELFPADDIPLVLKEARRVTKPGGRISIVSMATVPSGQSPSTLERTYIWMHRHFPHLVDCRPIDPARCLADAGYTDIQETRLEIWTMPVAAVTGRKPV